MRQLFASLVVVSLPLSAFASTFDFTTLGANNTLLSNSVTVGGVIADGLDLTAGTTAPLWLRNQTNDRGLGVCTETNCATGGGDVNELDNSGDDEAIRLTRPLGTTWKELWVSSLDSGGSDGNETGILYWSNNANSFSSVNSFEFSFFALPGTTVEGNILALSVASSFDPTALYVLFVNDTSNGENNDYLVWKGVVETRISRQEVPEPASIALLGLGLAGLGFSRRKQ